MAGLKDIASIWNNIREVDLRPIRDAALHEVKVGLVGEPSVGRHTLAAQMRSDPARPGAHTQTPLAIISPEEAEKVSGAELIILLVDATRNEYNREQALVSDWADKGKKVLVFCNKYDLLSQGQVQGQWLGWQAAKVLYGSANEASYLQREFVPAVLELLPAERHLALGRQFPLFRVPIAKDLISDTCFSNTAYAVSTGVAEIVPVLDLPLNVTDRSS
jgi:predicted GTPase